MIRKFRYTDLNGVTFNEFFHEDNYTFLRDGFFEKYSHFNELGELTCIMICYKYWGDNWVVSFAGTDKFSFKYAKEIKLAMIDLILIKGADRVQTDSVDCKSLNRWHKFLGFEFEGTRKNLMYGKDYNMWGMQNGN